MTRDRLNEHKENMDKIMDRLGGRRDDIWQDRFIYDIAAAIHDLLVEKDGSWRNDGSTCRTTLRACVDDAPSIEIVRCKECKYWRNKDPQQIPTASIMCGHMHPDDFCSYGERERSNK